MDNLATSVSSNFIIDLEYYKEIIVIIFHVLITFGICFSGSLSSDIWYYKRANQRINIAQDVIAGLFFSVLLNIIDYFFSMNIRVFMGVTFIVGIFAIDLMGLILQPKLIIIFMKHFFQELKGNPAAKAFGKTLDEIKKEEDKKEEQAEKEQERKDQQAKNDAELEKARVLERWLERNGGKESLIKPEDVDGTNISMQEYGFEIVQKNNNTKRNQRQQERN